MTTYSWTTPSSYSTDADFRSIGTSINTALSTIGLVQTSDTGQVDWTTVTKPSGNPTYSGYEIWRFNDTQQTSFPIFIKLEYGSTAVSASVGFRLSVGKGSNGSGTLTGAIMTNATIGYFGTTASASYASSSDSGMALYLTPTSTATSSFAIERSLDGSGNATGSGLAVVIGHYNSSGSLGYNWYTYKYATPSSYTQGCSPIQLPTVAGASLSASTSFSKDGSTGVAIPIPFLCPGVQPWVSKQLFAIAPGDAAVTFTASPHGTSHTYRGFPYVNGSCPVLQGTTSTPNISATTPAAIYWQ
jgi:hypothetical protein